MASCTDCYKNIFGIKVKHNCWKPLIKCSEASSQLKVVTRSIYLNIQRMPNGSSKSYCLLLGFPSGVLLLFLVFSSFPMNESPHQQFFSSLTLSSFIDHTNALQSSSSTSSLSNSPPISIKVIKYISDSYL